MSYQDVSALAQDAPFAQRVAGCLSTEAQGKDDHLAAECLRNPVYGAAYFMPFLSGAPGFAESYAAGGQEAIDDGMILSAVQASWADVSALYPEPVPE